MVVKANPPFFTMLAASDRFLELTQKDRADVTGKNLFNVFPDNDADPSGKLSAYRAFVEVIATRTQVDLPVYRYDIFVPAEGRQVPFYWSNRNEPILSADGTAVEYIINTTTNITARILLEKKEAESRHQALYLQQRINDMFMKAPIGMVLLTREKYIIEYANEMMCRMWNKGSADEVLARGVFELIPELESNGLRPIYDGVVNNDQPFFADEIPVTYNRDGTTQTYFFDIHMEPLHDVTGAVTGLMILTNDVTSSLTSRRQIAASEERLRMASEATGLGTFDVDLLNWQIYHSPELAVIFGSERDARLAWDDLVEQILPEDLPIRERAFERALVTGHYYYELRIRWKDQSVHWIRTHGKFHFDEAHKPIRLLGTSLEITEQKQEEMRKNDFLAIASHELKTPLTSLKLMIAILNEETGDAQIHNRPELLSKANRQINKMTALIHDFLDLSRIETGKVSMTMRPTSVNDLIARTVEEHRLLVSRGSIRFLDAEVPMLVIDEEKIGQVLDNILSNAIKYSRREPEIVIATRHDAAEVTVSITDSGIGIDHADQSRIFERFYRVDDGGSKSGSGFGIGLYLSADIIQRHGGRIWVESVKGNGSTFHFTLPVTDVKTLSSQPTH